jgi:hypothetical protein
MTDLVTGTKRGMYDALVASVALAALAAVHEHVPDGTEPPLVNFGDVTVEDQGDKDNDFEQHIVEVLSWYRGPDREGVRAIMAAVKNALHRQVITATGVTLTRPRMLGSDDRLEEDGITYSGSQRFSIWAQPAD